MIRGIVTSVIEGLIKLLAATGRNGESFTNREYFQHYGFTSRPLSGAEVIIIREGNHYLAVASDDRRYRIAVEAGEVALYTDEGDKIHLKRDKTIEIVSGNKLTATVENEVDITTKVAKVAASTSADITSPVATVNASTSCTITSPRVILTSASVELGDGTLRKLIDERLIATYNAHTHANWGSSPPNLQMSEANHCTSDTEAS